MDMEGGSSGLVGKELFMQDAMLVQFHPLRPFYRGEIVAWRIGKDGEKLKYGRIPEDVRPSAGQSLYRFTVETAVGEVQQLLSSQVFSFRSISIEDGASSSPLPDHGQTNLESKNHVQVVKGAGSCKTVSQCEPIIEEPATPEPECLYTLESVIEDAFWTEDPDEIPMIKLNTKEFMQNVENYMQEKGELQDVDMSGALVALTQEAATIPMPKLKTVSRLRTEHQMYELPNAHPLLAKLDRRELDDPCTYLLTVWTLGETAQSSQPPEIDCTSQKSGNLCSKKTCFTCNSMREANAQAVKSALLVRNSHG